MLEKLETLLVNHDRACEARKINNTKPVFKLPKYLFINFVVPFLDDEDIISLGNTCHSFNMMIYSPYTYRILLSNSIQRNSYYSSHQIAQSNSPIMLTEEIKYENIHDEDHIAQLETLRLLRDFLTQKVKTLNNVIKSNEKEMKQLNIELTVAKDRNKKNNDKIHFLEHQIKSFDIVKQDHSETVKELNMHYQALLAEKEQRLTSLVEKNHKLVKDKEVLYQETNKIRADKEKIEQMNIGFKEALSRIDSFFNFPSGKVQE